MASPLTGAVRNERLHAEQIVSLLVERVGESAREEIMNAAEELHEAGRQKGRQEGRQEGVLEGRRVVLLKQLGARFKTLPDAIVARVNSAGTADLEMWAERVLTAATLAEVMGDV